MNYWERIKYEFFKKDSAVYQIILINVAVWVLLVLFAFFASLGNVGIDSFRHYLTLSSDPSVLLYRPWTIITNIFIHGGFWHIAGNMILLYFIGRILQDFMSNRRVWTIFIGGGLAGCLAFILAYNFAPAFAGRQAFIMGASGGVTAILVAAGMHLPRYVLRPFGLFSIEMRWVALILVFRDIYSFPGNQNAGGLMAHVGGAIFGVLFILYIQGRIKLPVFERAEKKGNLREVHRDESKRKPGSPKKPNQEEIDVILDKISMSGYNSLTEEEKELLFKASE